jgi:hypothetical protein
MKDLKDILGKKAKLDPMEKDAKLAAIKGMRKMAGDMMADDMKSMKKVTVAAPDQEGLEAGLEKAKEVVESEEGPMHEMSESSDEDSSEMDSMIEQCESPEEIDQLMAKLAEKKAALMKG